MLHKKNFDILAISSNFQNYYLRLFSKILDLPAKLFFNIGITLCIMVIY